MTDASSSVQRSASPAAVGTTSVGSCGTDRGGWSVPAVRDRVKYRLGQFLPSSSHCRRRGQDVSRCYRPRAAWEPGSCHSSSPFVITTRPITVRWASVDSAAAASSRRKR
jgi:hypothetical protein